MLDQSTIRKLFRGSVFRVVAQFVTIFLTVITLPLMISKLGDIDYGIWVIIGSISGYYGALDFGLTSAVVRYVSKYIDNDDKSIAFGYSSTSFYFFQFLSLIVILVSVIISYNIDYFFSNIRLLKVDLALVVIISGGAVAVNFSSKTFSSLLISNLMYDVVSKIQIILGVGRSVSIVIILLLYPSLVYLSLTLLVTNICEWLILFYICTKKYSYKSISPNYFSYTKALELVHYGKYTFLAQLSDILRGNSYPFIIASVLGVGYVTIFNISQKLWIVLSTICSAMLSIFTPVFSKIDDTDEIEEIYWSATRASIIIGSFLFTVVLVLIEPILYFWLGEETLFKVMPYTVIISLSIYVSVIQMPTVNLLYGVGKNKTYAISNFIQAFSTIFVMYLSIEEYGLYGAAWSVTIVAIIVKIFIQGRNAAMVLGVPTFKYYKQLAAHLITPTIYLLLSIPLMKLNMTGSFIFFLFLSVCYVLMYLLFVWLFTLNKNEKELIIRNVENIKKKC